MKMEGFQEDPLLRHQHFLLQEKPLVSEGKTMKMRRVVMRKICFSLPPGLDVRQQGKQLLGEFGGSLQEVYAGH